MSIGEGSELQSCRSTRLVKGLERFLSLGIEPLTDEYGHDSEACGWSSMESALVASPLPDLCAATFGEALVKPYFELSLRWSESMLTRWSELLK